MTLLAIFCLLPNAKADFITPTSVTSLNSSPWSQFNDVSALISNATNTSYLAPNPSSGGNGTSTWTNQNTNTWTFNFASAYTLNTAYLWDYYTHSPTNWVLNFYDGLNGTGTQVGTYSFSIAPVCSGGCSTLHTISFADFANVKSVTLSNTNNSANGGVGLAEVHFGGVGLATNLSVSTEGVGQSYAVASYGGTSQDRSGVAEVQNVGASLYMKGNLWKKVDFPYTVTPNTVLEFDFSSAVQGEIHGIGFDNDLTISSDKTFKIYGTQAWGLSNFATYSGSGITHYSIPVGQFYTGNFNYLFFVNDHDVSNPTGEELFSNINVHEGITAGQLSGNLNVDNEFEAYISTDDAVQGTLLTSGTNWPTTYALATSLIAGQDYFLHIKATDVGGVAGFLGDFTLTGTDHTFSNGLTSLNTNTSNWRVSTTGWLNYQTPSAYGINGVSPWGTRSAVNANAQWIWSADNNADNLNYFSTKISAVNSCSASGTLNAVGIKIGSGGTDTQVNTTTEAQTILAQWQAAGSPATGLINNGMYNVTGSGSSTVDRIDFGGSNHDFSGTLPYPGASAGVGGSHFVVHASGTISLPAGDYTIFVEGDDGISFKLNSISGDAVVFNKFGSSTSGASNELRFENPTANSNTGGSFTLTQDSVFSVSAIFFERDGGDYFEISIANNIRTNAAPSGYEVLQNGALNGKVKFGCVTLPVIDHYEIIHDGNGLTCEPEIVSIKACTNAFGNACALSTDTVTLDVLATGSTAITSSISFTGSGTASIPYILAESVTLSLSNSSIASANPTVCVNGNTTSCNLVFADAGFRFLSGPTNSTVIPNQTSGTVFPDELKLQAVKNSSGVCTGLFSGNKNIELSQENVSPTGTSGLNFTVNGSNIAKHPSVTSTTLTFGADSIVTIPTPIYHDAGQIRLHANYIVGGVNLNGSSNPFWVSPASLVVSAKVGTTPLNGASATATPTQKAGDNFDFTVSATNSLGVITPNYSPGQVQFKLARTGPILGASVDGYLSYAQDSVILSSTTPVFQNVLLSNFVSGISTYSAAQYSEVGLINLDVQDNNYGNVGLVIPSAAVDIGRFTPDHFEQTVADKGSFLATCNLGTTFAFSGQKDQATNSVGAISYLANPVFAITAYNKQGVITQNYYEDSQGSANDYMKLSATDISITAPTLDQVAVGVDTTKLPLTANLFTGALSQNDLTLLPAVTALPKGVLHYRLSDTDNYFYDRSANALVAPFTSNVNISTTSISDTDSTNVTTTADALPTGVEIRFGRLRLENSFGPETSNLPQPMQTEFFDGADFVVSPNNNCVSFDAGNVSLTNVTLNPALTSVSGGTGFFVDGKTKTIELAAPGAGNIGNIGVSYTTSDWLKYDWNGDGVYDNNPSAIASFGLYRGNDRVIYWREISN